MRSFAVVSRRQRNNEKEKKKNFRTLVASFPPPSLSHMRGRRVDVGVIRWRRRLACCGGWRKVAGDWIRKTVLQFLLHNAVPDVKENTDLRWEPREETSRDISNIFSQRKRPDEWLRKKSFLIKNVAFLSLTESFDKHSKKEVVDNRSRTSDPRYFS